MNRACWLQITLLLIATGLSVAQAPAASNASAQQPAQGGYTLQAHVREVITDVTVADRAGNPVHGLPESAFHIFDNGKPQHLSSFHEHTRSEAAAPIEESPANVYTNDIVLHPPAVFNVIVLDTARISVIDQMYLRQELDRFVQTLPPDESFAIFARNGEHVIMLANFTADHQKLTKAINYELPRLIVGVDLNYKYVSADVSLMEEICNILEQYPGRKNVLWFKVGTSPMMMGLNPDPATVAGYVDLQPLYDELEKSRVALYPIDARGLQIHGSIAEELLMENQADATGGQAVFNNNGLAQAARHIADTDSSFYTLVYSPAEVKLDNRWHKVKVEVDGGAYQLSYRRGYYDDGSNLAQSQSPSRKRLLQAGETVPDLRMRPIVFKVTVTPAGAVPLDEQSVVRSSPNPPKRGQRAYALHYSVPMADLPQKTNGDRSEFTVGLGVLAFNQHGRAVGRYVNGITLGVAKERLVNASPDQRISFDQVINLPDGQDALYVAVWNTQNGRVGVVQIPLAVEKAKLR